CHDATSEVTSLRDTETQSPMGLLCVSESSTFAILASVGKLRLVPALGNARARASAEDRADARPPRAPELRRSGEGRRLLPEAVCRDGDQNDLQWLRGGEDGESLPALHEG